MNGQERTKELIDAAQNLSKEEKEKFINDFEFMLDGFWKVHKEDLDKKLEEKDIIIGSLVTQLKTSKVELINKEGIMECFKCKSDKALRILKFAHQVGGFDCVQMGKEYYISQEGLMKFIKTYDGKQLNI